MRHFVFSVIASVITFLPNAIALAAGAGLAGEKLNVDATNQELKFQEAVGFKNVGSKGVYNIIGALINALLSLLGVAFLVLTIYGGVVLFQARGDENEVKKAQKIIEQGVIGLVIVLGAYAIARFVLQRLTGVTLQ